MTTIANIKKRVSFEKDDWAGVEKCWRILLDGKEVGAIRKTPDATCWMTTWYEEVNGVLGDYFAPMCESEQEGMSTRVANEKKDAYRVLQLYVGSSKQ